MSKVPQGFVDENLAFEYLYQIKSFEDLHLLKHKDFLKSCGLKDIQWDLSPHLTENDIEGQSLKKEALTGVKESHSGHGKFNKSLEIQNSEKIFSQKLEYQNQNYGSLIFYSPKKISQKKKIFLEKISLSVSATLSFLEKKQKASLIKHQWESLFNAFPQAFCVTNQKIQIIRSNQAFKKLFKKSHQDIFLQKLFKLLPVKVPKSFIKRPSSFIATEENHEIYWEITCKEIHLKGESHKSFLFLIKDISASMEIEAKISSQSKNQEIGLMKGSLAHELNNPITGIKLLISVLEKEIPNEETLVQESLKEMQKATSICQNVIQNLLSASKKNPQPFG